MTTPMLEVRELCAWYGATQTLFGVGFKVMPGRVTAMLGANGAGKSTTLRAVTRMMRTTGEVRFEGRATHGMSTEDIAALGVAHVPEGRGTFGSLTVEENLKLGAWNLRSRAQIQAEMARMYEYFPILAQRRHAAAGMLSGGQQQILAVARALMSRPKLLLLDEPSLGLAPLITREIFAILRRAKEEMAIAILLVEQNARLALELADEVFLLETGRVVMSGSSEDFSQDDSIRKSYLGY